MPATLESRFPMIIAELRPRVSAAIGEVSQDIADLATEKVPVESGELRDAIHVERTGIAEYAVMAGDDKVFYGSLVEFGTSRSAAEPFLIPAAEEGMAWVEARVTAVLRGL